MATMTGLLALALVGAAPAADPCDEAISVQVRVFDMDGLGWRSEAHPRLRPVANRGTSTVWTADRSLLDDLVARAKIVSTTPRVDAVGEAAVSNIKPVHYVARQDRVGGTTTPISFKPAVETIDAGIEARVRGRKLDQGMLAQVLISDTRVLAMHQVKFVEDLHPTKPAPDAPKPTDNAAVGAFLKTTFGVSLATKCEGGAEAIGTNIQVPEVAHAEIEGEWLIPNDGILVVSLGVDTVANHLGRAIPRERLAVVELSNDQPPTPIAVSQLNQALTEDTLALMAVDPAFQHNPDSGRIQPFAGRSYADIVANIDEVPTGRLAVKQGLNEYYGQLFRTQDEAVVTASFDDAAPTQPILPTPAAPSRMLPLPVDGNGNVVELPPLPIAASTLDESLRPAANQPSPQSVHLSMADPAISQATFLAPAPGVTTTTVVSTSGPSLGFGIQMKDGQGTPVQEVEKDLTTALKTPGKTETIRVPLGGSLSLEIKATVVPSRSAEPAVADGSGDSADRK
ncbi:hypothetical protein TA3x_004415 [Tundrisphaera sp. TA3]|uniref:hypothetical protein n=1 Tax=Tundrisphaera sp. TA3 TaxID=3435775 RepID=UPI003EBBDBCA